VKIIENGKKIIRFEAESIANMEKFIDENFELVVKKIFSSKGRVIITGIGKSANIGKKIVATLNSTGTPSVFMHAAEAIHGDLGIVQKDDVVICISKSGNTSEMVSLVPIIKDMGNFLVGMVGDQNSFLAKNADAVLLTTVDKEACPNNLAPTSSTTAQLVMGDALASCLIEMRGFTEEDFARFHPGGSLGKKLYYKVETLMNLKPPRVNENTSIKETLIEISSKRMGATAVLNVDEKIVGIITDGDIRRMIERYDNFLNLKAKDIMSKAPKTIDKNLLASVALKIMEDNSITQLIVIENDKYVGMIHLHDILKEGIS